MCLKQKILLNFEDIIPNSDNNLSTKDIHLNKYSWNEPAYISEY